MQSRELFTKKRKNDPNFGIRFAMDSLKNIRPYIQELLTSMNPLMTPTDIANLNALSHSVMKNCFSAIKTLKFLKSGDRAKDKLVVTENNEALWKFYFTV